MKWEPDLLLQVGMDGPNVNLKFEKDLAHQISDSYGVSYINLGSCGMHQTHNTFRKGILEFGKKICKASSRQCLNSDGSSKKKET